MLKSFLVSTVKNYHTVVKIGNDNTPKDPLNPKSNYTKVIIEDPYNNREIIARVAKKQKGVYVWETETLDGKSLYVGHSINLYNRICSYFMPSILKTKERRVLRYFNKYGFSKIKLTIYLMDNSVSLEEVVELEQHFIDSLNPNLNVDLVARSSGYHDKMSQEIRARLRKERGTPVFVYDAKDFTLLYIFESKTHMYNTINIHHKTLNDCIDSGLLYLGTFFLSLDQIEESTKTNLLSLDKIKAIVSEKREIHGALLIKHQLEASKAILAEFKDDSRLNREFGSLSSLARELKGDRQVIREYLSGIKSGYYRGKWKFTYLGPKTGGGNILNFNII
uniref:GIY-YIG endonuclease n=1 Tax=Pyronema omphalodes TaxID=337075 RepID=A0A140IMV8_9PEZI|nr:GIY-YIG endonuclease [Pyronema omphalodes]AMO66516.1 GIY-YIG endonuclease [Pyronema omphalodes]